MYFIDRKKITKTLDYLEALMQLFGEKNWEEPTLEECLALERLAHGVIESMLDVGNAMIDGFIMRDPGSYDDIIDILEDEKVITAEMEQPLKAVIALRKMIVRDFIAVNDEEIQQVLAASQEALQAFAPKVRHYIENELGPVSAFLPVEEGS